MRAERDTCVIALAHMTKTSFTTARSPGRRPSSGRGTRYRGTASPRCRRLRPDPA